MLIKVDSKFISGYNALKNTLLVGSKEQARNFYTAKGKKVLKMAKKTFPDATIETIEQPHAPRGRAVAAKRGRPPKAKTAKSKRGPGRPTKAKRGRPPKTAVNGGVKRGRGRPKGSKNKPKTDAAATVESNGTATAVATTPSTQA